jgi:exonuclease III
MTKNTEIKTCKNNLTVGTCNVQTLWAAGKLELLWNEMKRFRYDIIGISEVRWTWKGETPNGDFIWSGEEKSYMRAVGLLLSTQAKKALIGYNTISSRIISTRFDAVPFKISVIHVYAPTSSSSEEDIEAFYNDIKVVLAQTDRKDLIILTGDWNAKIGNDNSDWKSVMGKYGYGDSNERGERLLKFATVHNFFICNTRFQQKSNRKWTWVSPNGIHKNMIDFILIQDRWKISIINCRTFQTADISSDHSLVLCNISSMVENLGFDMKYATKKMHFGKISRKIS